MRSIGRASVVMSLAGCLVPTAAGAEQQAFNLDPGTRVLAPIEYRQLALFPVVQATAKVDRRDYVTLTEGLQRKEVQVTEAKGGATVNHVTVKNRARRPLLLLGGEIILGGQQDRILGKDTIIPPGEEVSLEVYCVEHGRWSGRHEFTRAGGMVEGKARMNAKFKSDQGGVWEAVASKTRALQAETATGTYRTLATGVEGERAVKPYRDHVLAALARLPDSSKMVGLIAAINGRVTSVDVFASPRLFAAYRSALLDAVFVSAADAPASSMPVAAPAPAAIREFLDRADSAPATEVVKQRKSHTTEKKGRGVGNSTLRDDEAPAAAPVYRSYQAM